MERRTRPRPGTADPPPFPVPNLDDLGTEPEEFKRAAALFDSLAAYCRLKALAVQARRQGDINIAAGAEGRMDRIHALLPEWARW